MAGLRQQAFRWKWIFILTPLMCGASQSPMGILNAFEGEVRINGVAVGLASSGQAMPGAGGSISTGQGMAELLLSPGSFLRLGERSELTLGPVRASEIHLQLRKGEAMLEVIDLQIPIVLEENGRTATIRKPGLYGFSEKHAVMTVYAGEAQLSRNGRQKTTGQGSSLYSPLYSPLYSWSRIRSEQLSDESAASALAYPGGAGSLRGPTWYRVPWSDSYTFLSASGAVTGPFGWPYYSPGYTPNAIPTHPSGDLYLYGPPVPMQSPATQPPLSLPGVNTAPYTVPLTAPGVPQFPNSRQ